MLLPNTATLTCYIGGTWDQEFDFWDDKAETIAHNFSGWSVSMLVTNSDGSTVAPSVMVTGGVVVASLTAAQTATLPAQTSSYVLMMDNGANPDDVEFLMHGQFKIISP